MTIRNPKHTAYTLFEVLLSLALLLVLMTLIGTAINTHLRSQFHNRLQVEEAQLARAILHRIAEDLRHIVLDPEGEENAPASDVSEEDMVDDTSAETDTEYDYVENGYYYFESDIVGTRQGLYGGRDWIQIDTYRTIPGERFTYNADDPYNYYTDEMEFIPELDILSCGQKTVLYYLGYETGSTEADEEFQRRQQGTSVEPERYRQGPYNSTGLQYGLYCREMNRPITEYAVEMGLDTAMYMIDNDEHLAPEVDNIEFAYFINDDPEKSPLEGQWLESWDMDTENGALPLAVRIKLSIRRKTYKPTLIGGLMSGDSEQDRVVAYTLIVPLSREMIDLTVVEEASSDSDSAL